MKLFLDSPDLLKTVTSEAEKNNDVARTLAGDLSEAQLNWKPSSDRWSIAQCLEHLTVATNQFDKYFKAALEKARKKQPITSPPQYRPTMMGGWLAKQVAPEAPRKLRAPKVLRPAAASGIKNSLQRFLDQHDEFIDFVRQCNGLDYNRTRLRSPVTPLI